MLRVLENGHTGLSEIQETSLQAAAVSSEGLQCWSDLGGLFTTLLQPTKMEVLVTCVFIQETLVWQQSPISVCSPAKTPAMCALQH